MVGGWGGQPCAQEAAKDNGLQLKGKGCKVYWPGISTSLTHGHKVSASPSPLVGQRASVRQKKNMASFLLSPKKKTQQNNKTQSAQRHHTGSCFSKSIKTVDY